MRKSILCGTWQDEALEWLVIDETDTTLLARVFLLSVKELAQTYALTNEEIYRPLSAKFWTRSPDSHCTVLLANAGEGILKGESPYMYEVNNYNPITDVLHVRTYPYFAYTTSQNAVIPALRIRK